MTFQHDERPASVGHNSQARDAASADDVAAAYGWVDLNPSVRVRDDVVPVLTIIAELRALDETLRPADEAKRPKEKWHYRAAYRVRWALAKRAAFFPLSSLARRVLPWVLDVINREGFIGWQNWKTFAGKLCVGAGKLSEAASELEQHDIIRRTGAHRNRLVWSDEQGAIVTGDRGPSYTFGLAGCASFAELIDNPEVPKMGSSANEEDEPRSSQYGKFSQSEVPDMGTSPKLKFPSWGEQEEPVSFSSSEPSETSELKCARTGTHTTAGSEEAIEQGKGNVDSLTSVEQADDKSRVEPEATDASLTSAPTPQPPPPASNALVRAGSTGELDLGDEQEVPAAVSAYLTGVDVGEIAAGVERYLGKLGVTRARWATWLGLRPPNVEERLYAMALGEKLKADLHAWVAMAGTDKTRTRYRTFGAWFDAARVRYVVENAREMQERQRGRQRRSETRRSPGTPLEKIGDTSFSWGDVYAIRDEHDAATYGFELTDDDVRNAMAQIKDGAQRWCRPLPRNVYAAVKTKALEIGLKRHFGPVERQIAGPAFKWDGNWTWVGLPQAFVNEAARRSHLAAYDVAKQAEAVVSKFADYGLDWRRYGRGLQAEFEAVVLVVVCEHADWRAKHAAWEVEIEGREMALDAARKIELDRRLGQAMEVHIEKLRADAKDYEISFQQMLESTVGHRGNEFLQLDALERQVREQIEKELRYWAPPDFLECPSEPVEPKARPIAKVADGHHRTAAVAPPQQLPAPAPIQAVARPTAMRH